MFKIKAEFFFGTESEGVTKVWIYLTDKEHREMKRASWKFWLYFWHPFKCRADYMSSELEALLCGHVPERYVPRTS